MSFSCSFSLDFAVEYVSCMELVVTDLRTKPQSILSWNVPPNSNDETKHWLFNASFKV